MRLILCKILFLILFLASGCCSVTVIKPVEHYGTTVRACIRDVSALQGNQIDGISVGVWCGRMENLHRYKAGMQVMSEIDAMIDKMIAEEDNKNGSN